MRSCDVISEVWEVRCEKWNCDELGCDKLWWVVMRSGPVRSGAVMSCDEQWSCDEWGVRSGAVMSWYVISCDELWWVVLWCVLRLPSQGSRGPSGAHARRSSSRRLCVLHLPRKRQPQPQRRPRAPQLLQEALCTAPAMRKAAAAPAAPTRAAAPPGGSVYCACHAKGSRGPSGAHARRSSSRRLCVLHLPRKRQPRPQRRPRAPQLLQEALCTLADACLLPLLPLGLLWHDQWTQFPMGSFWLSSTVCAFWYKEAPKSPPTLKEAPAS